MAAGPSEATAALRDFRVDRSSPIPLYFQVSQHIEDAIASGRVPSGTILENEIQLAEQLGLSRPTMRRAMETLVDKGLIVRRRGVGTRVVQPKVKRPLELSSLYDDLSATGQAPTTTVLSVERVAATADVAERLGCAEGEEVLRTVRLRRANGRPIAKMTNYLPASVGEVTAEDLQRSGLYALLRGRGIQFHSANQSVGARNAVAAESRLLEEPRHAALLTMQRTTYDDHGAVVEFGTHLYAASRYTFEIDLLSP